MVDLESRCVSTSDAMNPLKFLELIPLYGAWRAMRDFDLGFDTLPIKQNQTFQEAHNSQFLFVAYHYVFACAAVAGTIYKISEYIK